MRALHWSFRRFGTSSSSSGNVKKTVLNDFHRKKGGKMVDFAGYDMPVQYSDMSIIDSTKHTRINASIFDVSHMGQLLFKGKDRISFLDWLLVSSIESLKDNQCKYSLLCNDHAGIVDDLVLTNRSSHNCHYMVINASRIEPDLSHINSKLEQFKSKYSNKSDVHYEILNKYSLIALQGPKAHLVMQQLGDIDFKNVKFFYSAECKLSGIPCHVSRSGYTGEDGFEIQVPHEHVQSLVERMLAYQDKNSNSKEQVVRLAGLGARDSLRLEAGLCLYGNDLRDDITPNEADLMWTISKQKRENGVFVGSNVIRDQAKNGVKRIRIGMIAEKGASPRSHMSIKNDQGEVIGEVTSGGFSPCLDKPIAMGYVSPKYSSIDTKLKVAIRSNKDIDVKVCKLPFVTKGYFGK